MKKIRYNYSSNTTTLENKLNNAHAAEKLVNEAALPTPPTEEVVARLNAIAREYPFCAYIKQNDLFML